jgi:methyl-accepting chemotaxis protein
MSRLRDLRVASKLFAGFTVVVVLLVTVGVVGFVGLRAAQHRLEDMYGNSVVSVSSLQRVQTDFVQSLKSLDDLVIADDETHTATATDDLKTADAALAADWKAYLGTHPAQTGAQLARFDTTLSSYLSARAGVEEIARSLDSSSFPQRDDATLKPLETSVESQLNDMVARELAAASASRQAGGAAYTRATELMIATIAVAVVASVLIAVVIARSIARPLARVVEVVRGLAQGHLDERVGLTSEDEIGVMAQAFGGELEPVPAGLRRHRADLREHRDRRRGR